MSSTLDVLLLEYLQGFSSCDLCALGLFLLYLVNKSLSPFSQVLFLDKARITASPVPLDPPPLTPSASAFLGRHFKVLFGKGTPSISFDPRWPSYEWTGSVCEACVTVSIGFVVLF